MAAMCTGTHATSKPEQTKKEIQDGRTSMVKEELGHAIKV
jgi:hypothetical protein